MKSLHDKTDNLDDEAEEIDQPTRGDVVNRQPNRNKKAA